MLNGLIKPDRGTITMRGRVGALIALGAGFNPILTGRENIYINGSVLGLTKKEIDAKIDEIIDFAEIREFIDMPVQSYSSGMTVRLGFAVATALDPDVLILDEVLAVGDGSFRHKCYQRIDSLRGKAAIIFVSHNMPDVGRICQSTVVMERGRTIFHGNANEGIGYYNKINIRNDINKNLVKKTTPPINDFDVIYQKNVKFNQSMEVHISINSSQDIDVFHIEAGFLNEFGGYAAIGILSSSELGLKIGKGNTNIKLDISNIPLRNGEYSFIFHLIDHKGFFIAVEEYLQNLNVDGNDNKLPSDCILEIKNLNLNQTC
jgi:lipopolysaccharide transport system ATP-binding protein